MNDDIALFNDLVKVLNLKSKKRIKTLSSMLESYDVTKCINATSLGEWKERFLEVKKSEGVRPGTLWYYEGHLEDVCNLFGKNVNPDDISRVEFNKVLLNVESLDKSQNSKWQIVSTIRIFWNWLEGEKAISKNFMRNIKYKQKKNTRHPMTDEEVEMMRKACKTTEEKVLFEFLITTGCRASEVPKITWKDINLTKCTCNVTGKGDKKRVVIFSNNCAKLIRKYKKECNDGEHVFCMINRKGQPAPINQGHLQQTIKHISKRTKIKDSVFCHRLRHTFASQCLDRGMDLVSIQKLLGHSDISTTQVYAELNMEQIKREYDKIHGRH